MPADALSGDADFGPGGLAQHQAAALAVGPTLFVVLETGRIVAHWRARALGRSPAFTLHEDGTRRPLLNLDMEDGSGSQPEARPFRVSTPGGESLGQIARESAASGWRLVLRPADGQRVGITFHGRQASIDGGLGTVTRKPLRRGLGRYPADNYEIDVHQRLVAPLPALLVAATFAESVWSERAEHAPGGKHLMKDLASVLGATFES